MLFSTNWIYLNSIVCMQFLGDLPASLISDGVPVLSVRAATKVCSTLLSPCLLGMKQSNRHGITSFTTGSLRQNKTLQSLSWKLWCMWHSLLNSWLALDQQASHLLRLDSASAQLFSLILLSMLRWKIMGKMHMIITHVFVIHWSCKVRI